MDSAQAYGYMLYFVSLMTMGGIYAIMCLGLNIQWGFTGLFNAGIAGFFAIGAYVTAILTTAESMSHLGGYDMPVVFGLISAMVVTAVIAWLAVSPVTLSGTIVRTRRGRSASEPAWTVVSPETAWTLSLIHI